MITPGRTILNKQCNECGAIFVRDKKLSQTQWAARAFCSNKCSAKVNGRRLKGKDTWNKGTKGIMKANSGTWVKKDSRLYGKKQTYQHKLNAACARFNRTSLLPDMTKEQLTTYRYFYHLNKKYKLSREDYERMFNEQGGLCYLCTRSAKDRLCVDHCHKTGVVRKLLCRKCNSTLGLIDDDTETLKRMIKYLRLYANTQ